ncbi:PEP-CTERM/exosortase system-associated acyltransferase [Niveibacterium sp. SC-1]|uniref:PEP-CTERM/exosortase system-associated acyltransferase n=1 Tax=Niveibacterium sp. SC-1 TaxID=3135646 RepID=UPI00311FF278
MSILDRFNLGEGFKRYFQVRPALSDPDRHKVFRIRHQVYCEELNWEPPRPSGEECDNYDQFSLHCLMTRSEDPNNLVGCTRIVMPPPDDPSRPLPFERSCADSIDRRIIDPTKLPRESIAEISRLAVRAQYRRRKGEDRQAVPIPEEEDRGTEQQPRFPYIPLGLYMASVALAHRRGIETLFVLTEPRLSSHFAKLGVEIIQIGTPIEHRGTRIPSMMQTSKIIKGLRFFMRPMYRTISDEVDRAIEASRSPSGHMPH